MSKKVTYMRKVLYIASISAAFLLITGCTDNSEEAYNSSIQNGLDVLASEEYSKAEVFFELALQEKPDSVKAKALLEQTTTYNEALQLFEDGSYEDALFNSEAILVIEDGSNTLILKANQMIENITTEMSTASVAQTSSDEVESNQNNEDSDINQENTKYSYKDIEGIYAEFESTPYESPIEFIAVFNGDTYISGMKSSSYSIADIINLTIDKSIMRIEYVTRDLIGEGSFEGDTTIELIDDNGKLVLNYSEVDLKLYPVTNEQVLAEGWNLEPVTADYNNDQDEVETEIKEAGLDDSSDIIDAYNQLSLPLKVVLAATTVGERAMTPELLGFNLYYKFDEESLLVNVHSGAGIGHPWYVIDYDNTTITPVEGVVYAGIAGHEDTYVDTTPVSKVVLYNRYMDSKASYDIAVQNVVESSDMTLLEYDMMRSDIYR